LPVSAEFVDRAPDPRGGNAGFTTFTRLDTGKGLAFAGFGRTPIGSNAVALYDPVQDAWQITLPSTAWNDSYDVRGRTFLGNRSGNAALLVGTDYWALDGDRGFSPLGNYRGVLDTRTWQWRIDDVATQFGPTGAALPARTNAAAGWLPSLDVGYLFGGTVGAAASDSLSRIA
jgi:hypothetical protein